ncbi:MAG: hypothetical protein AAF098_17180 [Pseudomonadota bacterium]
MARSLVFRVVVCSLLFATGRLNSAVASTLPVGCMDLRTAIVSYEKVADSQIDGCAKQAQVEQLIELIRTAAMYRDSSVVSALANKVGPNELPRDLVPVLMSTGNTGTAIAVIESVEDSETPLSLGEVQALLEAAIVGDNFEGVQSLIQIDRLGDRLRGPAIEFAAAESPSIFAILAAADPQALEDEQLASRVLVSALVYGNPTLVSRVLEMGADPNGRSTSGRPVILAAFGNQNDDPRVGELHWGIMKRAGADESAAVCSLSLEETEAVLAKDRSWIREKINAIRPACN